MEIEKSMKGNLFSSNLKSHFKTIQEKEDFSSFFRGSFKWKLVSSNVFIKYHISQYHKIVYQFILVFVFIAMIWNLLWSSRFVYFENFLKFISKRIDNYLITLRKKFYLNSKVCMNFCIGIACHLFCYLL
jgi:hypothetical protein